MSNSVALSPVARQLFLNPSNGAPASGFKLFTYEAGTTTKLATYTDASGATPNTNPIILDTLGECDLWLTGSPYKLVFAYPTDTDPPTNPIWSRDNIQSSAGSSGSARTITGNTTVVLGDGIIEADATAGPITIIYPLALGTPTQAHEVTIVKIDATTNPVRIVSDAAPTVPLGALIAPANGDNMQSATVYSDGSALRFI